MTLIFGIQPIKEALAAGKFFEKIWIQQPASHAVIREIIRELKNKKIPFQTVPEQKLNSLTKGKNHQGIAGTISEIEYFHLEDIVPPIFESGQVPFLLVLDKVTDVRNFGSIARTAECLGIHALVVPARGNAPVHQDAIRSSAGALLHIPVCRELNLKKSLEYLAGSGIEIIAVHEKTEKNIYEISLSGPVALLMGNEEKGISREYLKFCSGEGRIPMKGKTASLNVAIAASVAMYEVIRQRKG